MSGKSQDRGEDKSTQGKSGETRNTVYQNSHRWECAVRHASCVTHGSERSNGEDVLSQTRSQPWHWDHTSPLISDHPPQSWRSKLKGRVTNHAALTGLHFAMLAAGSTVLLPGLVGSSFAPAPAWVAGAAPPQRHCQRRRHWSRWLKKLKGNRWRSCVRRSHALIKISLTRRCDRNATSQQSRPAKSALQRGNSG